MLEAYFILECILPDCTGKRLGHYSREAASAHGVTQSQVASMYGRPDGTDGIYRLTAEVKDCLEVHGFRLRILKPREAEGIKIFLAGDV